MSLFGLFKSLAQKQAELDIAYACLKLQSVDSGIKVYGAEDLLARAEKELKNKNWENASSLAYKLAKESINSAKASLENAKSSGVMVSIKEEEFKKAENVFNRGDYKTAKKLAIQCKTDIAIHKSF